MIDDDKAEELVNQLVMDTVSQFIDTAEDQGLLSEWAMQRLTEACIAGHVQASIVRSKKGSEAKVLAITFSGIFNAARAGLDEILNPEDSEDLKESNKRH